MRFPTELDELISALREEASLVISTGGKVHPDDAFDLAYHVGELLGLDVTALENQARG